MLLPTIILLTAAFGGAALTYLWDNRATFGARMAAGVCVGMTLLGFVGYVLAAGVGMSGGVVGAATVASATPLLLLLRPNLRTRAKADLRAAVRLPRRLRPRRTAHWLTLTVLAVLLAWLFRGTLYVQEGALWTNNHNNFGDLPFHLAIVQGFAVGKNYPPQHPEFAGVRLTYPFLLDFVAALLVRAGASLSGAFLLQNLLLGGSLLLLLFRAGVLLTRRVGAAILAPVLFVFSGGLGFLLARDDWRQSGKGLWGFLADLPHDYTTGADRGLRWGNTMTALLTTQRGLLLAIPLALIVLTIWWREAQRQKADRTAYRHLALSGVITGLIPLVHGHTFLVLLIVGGFLALSDVLRNPARVKPWAACFALALLLAIPQALLLASGSGSHSGSFLGWQPGWDKGSEASLPFWWRNLGLFSPLLLLALVWRAGRVGAPVPPRLLRFYAPFVLCFVMANLLRLAPWVWDNIKVLLYWHLVSALLVSALLAHGWRWRRGAKTAGVLIRRTGILVAVLLMTLSGGLDILRIARGEARYAPVFSADAVQFAGQVQTATRPGDVLLVPPLYNAPTLLTGRPEVMGYEGHLWSHGLDYAARKADVQRIYAGAPDTPALLARYGVRFVVVGTHDDEGDYPVNDTYWNEAHFAVATAYGPYRLYRVAPTVQ